jgi:hypothetical protein
MEYKSYVDILSALLTPLIAMVTTYIAIQQYRNNRLKLRHDLYDRRLAVLKATNRFIMAASRSRGFTWDVLGEFGLSKAEAYFLFDQNIYGYLEGVYKRGLEILSLEYQRKQSVPEDEQGLIYQLRDHQRWFSDQLDTLNERFAKYLSLKSLR